MLTIPAGALLAGIFKQFYSTKGPVPFDLFHNQLDQFNKRRIE
jgi:hypothetical protein